jgi:hypothetical protein
MGYCATGPDIASNGTGHPSSRKNIIALNRSRWGIDLRSISEELCKVTGNAKPTSEQLLQCVDLEIRIFFNQSTIWFHLDIPWAGIGPRLKMNTKR